MAVVTDLPRPRCQSDLDCPVIDDKPDYPRLLFHETAAQHWHKLLGKVPKKRGRKSFTSFDTAESIFTVTPVDVFLTTIVLSSQDVYKGVQAVAGLKYVMKCSGSSSGGFQPAN